jgi:hypothetical protein
LPFVADVGSVLAHRDVAGYSLSMSHLFDLTDAAFAGLRLPAALAAFGLLSGPFLALRLRQKQQHLAATTTVALTSAVFLVATHLALVRFGGMLGSRPLADTINRLSGNANIARHLNANAQLMIYGDQSNASSVVFYTGRQALLINGRSSSMVWGSYYPDAPHVFLSDDDFLRLWGTVPRHYLIVTSDDEQHVQRLLEVARQRGDTVIKLQELADKTLYTDEPLL